MPKPIQPPPNLKPLIRPNSVPRETQKKARRKFKQWLKDNRGIIILNFGSIASFLSFTRTDILELRLLSITGSLSSVIYFLSRPPPIVLGPIIWSSVFAGTNAYMVYHIYEERKGKPKQLTSQEQDVYEEHFLPHAVTPRQFEKLISIAKKIELERGNVLIQKGQAMSKVYLVIRGKTEACTTTSRRVTVASSSPGNKEKLVGGDAGAWVGELAFLDYLSDLDKQTGVLKPPPPPLTALTSNAKKVIATTASAPDADEKELAPVRDASQLLPPSVSNNDLPVSNTSAAKNSILTYIATEKSELYEWDFEQLSNLLKTSSDLRSAITRSMTAAVVGKVVNMYISKATADEPLWKKWLAGQSVTNATAVSSSIPGEKMSIRVNISHD